MNVHLTQPTPALTPAYLTSRRGVDTEDGSLASDHDYHIVICSVTRGLVQRPGRPWAPCVMLPTNPAPYTIVEWGIQTARYSMYAWLALFGLGNIQTLCLLLTNLEMCKLEFASLGCLLS